MNREQFISRYLQDLAIYLKEVAPGDHDEVTRHARLHLSAHNQPLGRKRNRVGNLGQANTKAKDYGEVKCFICHKAGHKVFEYNSEKKAERKCFNCCGLNHEAKDCPSPGQRKKKSPTKAAGSFSIKQELNDTEKFDENICIAATEADI